MSRYDVPDYEWDGETATQRGQRPARKVRRLRRWGPSGGAPAGPTPVIDNDWLTYCHADAGPVGTPTTAVGNPVTDVLSLAVTGGSGPYDWEQTGSADRLVISETTMSGGRRTIDSDGSTDHMLGAVGLAAEISGSAVPHSAFIHCQILTTPARGTLLGAGGNDGGVDTRSIIETVSTTSYRYVRRDNSGSAGSAEGGTPATEEVVVIWSYNSSDQITVWVRNGSGLTKVIDNGLLTEPDSLLTAIAICCALSLGVTPENLASIGARVWGMRLGTIDDTQAATIGGLYGT